VALPLCENCKPILNFKPFRWFFITAKADLTQPQQFQALGVREAIAKPFNPLTLHDQIATSLAWDKAVAIYFTLTRVIN
jgi:response regulator RpfG family c-di-GMP phosphodiesterase